MSKSKRKHLFQVSNENGKVIVFARHEKGARSIASEYLENVKANDPVEILPDNLANKAVNRKGII